MENKTIYVSFHVGRGGRFHNPGFVRFIEECDFQTLIEKNSYHLTLIDSYWDEDKGQEIPLAESEWKLIDSGSNVILVGKENIDAKKGILNFDNDYDTDVTRTLDELDDKEWDALRREYKHFGGHFMSDELKSAVIEHFCLDEEDEDEF